jgi:hypothetical protein
MRVMCAKIDDLLCARLRLGVPGSDFWCGSVIWTVCTSGAGQVLEIVLTPTTQIDSKVQ